MTDINNIHTPVMLEEVISYTAHKRGGRYLDGTLGLGGHAEAILECVPDSHVCALDQDCEALELARERLARFGKRAHLFHMRFGEFGSALENLGWSKIDGAILDLGVSSLQLDRPERGFSFRASGPLDMRMDQKSGCKSAWHLVNRGSYAELRDCLAIFGEEPQAGRIARYIVEAREKKLVESTTELAEIVRKAYSPAWRRTSRRHPATKAFQALRMAVNDESGQLKLFLEDIWKWLADGARLVVISFHSIEDRLVKQAMCAKARQDENGRIRLLFKKPLTPSEGELSANPRSGSAKMRVAEKVTERQ